MNILFNSIIIFFYLVAPGLVFLKNYYNYELSNSEAALNMQQKFFVTLLPGFIIHSVFYFLAMRILELIDGAHCDFYKAGILLSPKGSSEFAQAFASLKPNLLWIFVYTVSLIVFSKLLGVMLRKGENYLRGKSQFLESFMSRRSRFNIWNEVFYVPPSLTENQIYLLLIHVVTEIDGQAVIYKGILERYEVTEKGGDLKCILLRYVKKLPFRSGKSESDGVAITNGSQEQLLIPYSEIKNMKVNKIRLHLNETPVVNSIAE